MKKEYFLLLIILFGLFMRLIWTTDMEWKGDETYMYTAAHESINKGIFPNVGMESGGGLVNPGLSVGIFAAIASFTNDPIAMDRVVEISNVIAILCFLIFIFYKIDLKEKETWLLGIVLASISPLAVLFSRKIWAQDMLPIFSFLIILTNFYRNKKSCAFLWGLLGAIIGQIHMSGFFFAFGLFVFTVIHDRYNKINFKWAYWIAGSAIGSISLIPWILFIIQNPQMSKASFWHIFQFNFYLYWLLDSLGLNIYYSLRKDFWQFIREPIVAGIPTYLVAVAHLFLVFISFILFNKILKYFVRIYHLIKQKKLLENIFIGISITKFYLLSILLGLGIFMTLSGTTIYQHYIICAFPFTYIFFVKIFNDNKKIIYSVIIAQLIISASFLTFIHKNNGAENGNYGKAYHAQIEQKKYN